MVRGLLMIRIDRSKLSLINGKYHYKGEAFSGISFEFSDNRLNDASKYLRGIKDGRYISEYLPETDLADIIRVPDNFNDYLEILLFEGKPFSGVAHRLDDSYYTCEYLYKDGELVKGVCWLPEGELDWFYHCQEDLIQEYEWRKSGKVASIDVRYRKEDLNLRFNLAFTKNSKIKSIRIIGEYFKELPKIVSRLQFNIFESKRFLRSIVADSSLALTGSGIDSSLLDYLEDRDGLREVKSILLGNTSLDRSDFVSLAKLENLEQIYVDDTRSEVAETLKGIKKLREDIRIIINRDVVSI